MAKVELIAFGDSAGVLHIKVGGRFIDSYQHLNHVAWGIFLGAGRIRAAKRREIPIAEIPGSRTFLRQMHIDFKNQIKEGDEINIVTTARREEELVIFNQKILRDDLSQPVGEATTVYGQPDLGLTASSERPLLDLSLKLDKEFFLLKGHKIKDLAAPACFEEERLRLLRSRGLTMEKLTEMGILVMATSIDLSFARDMHIGQEANIRTNVYSKGVRLIFHQQMAKKGQVLNKAQTTYVSIDITGKEPKIMRPPAQLIDQLTGAQTIDIPYSRHTRWL